ncbi:hypothetical protein [Nesterenkonia muleiensis]|uniref:hypothetical protein n=1 Tax=Nesterenkonia muleiensis TaxID=2282648 RepID=UPI0013006323|nr:hypothetical protein [Nesterenkonia muleiensis]
MAETYFPAAEGSARRRAGAPPPPPASSAERPSVALGEDPSVTSRFIAEQVEPQYQALRRWSSTMPHDELLQRAARRRRMTIKKITDSNQLFFLSGVLVGGMDGVITSLVSHQARRVSRSKAMTKRYLNSAEVPTPKGKAINPTDFSRAVKYMKALGKQVAVKPSAGRAAKGISVKVTREAELRRAWQAAMAARSATSESRYLIMIEEYAPGLDVRCYVVGGEVVGAVVRLPLYVVGDGVSTVGSLADAEIARRRPNEYLKPRQPEVTDAFLAPMAVTRDTVLSAGTLQYLTPIADTARGGGIAVDVLDLLGDELKDLAVDGLWAIPGLGAAAVDLLVPDLGSADEAVVLEVNPYANIMQFHYPSYGQPRKVNDAIMEEILERASR